MNLNYTKGAIPLYLQIGEILKERIENRTYANGSIIPSEKELEKEFDVSRITIRQAIAELERLGYVKRERGRGTSVIYESSVVEFLTSIKSFTNEMLERGITPKTLKCQLNTVKANREVSEKFRINEGDEVLLLHRVRAANDEAIVVFDTYLSKKYNLPLDEKLYMNSMYDVFDKVGILKPNKVKEQFISTLANKKIAKELHVEIGSPIFKRVRTSYSKDGDIIEYTICHYRGDRYNYEVEYGN